MMFYDTLYILYLLIEKGLFVLMKCLYRLWVQKIRLQTEGSNPMKWYNMNELKLRIN
jgi:hypothetical protein